jgi:hypothetical protein
MPRGPKGEKRPSDVIGAAKVQISTETLPIFPRDSVPLISPFLKIRLGPAGQKHAPRPRCAASSAVTSGDIRDKRTK